MDLETPIRQNRGQNLVDETQEEPPESPMKPVAFNLVDKEEESSDREEPVSNSQQQEQQMEIVIEPAPEPAPVDPAGSDGSEGGLRLRYDQIQAHWEETCQQTEDFIHTKFEEAHKALQHMHAAYLRAYQVVSRHGDQVLAQEVAKVAEKEQQKENIENALLTYYDGLKKLQQNIDFLNSEA